MKNWLMKLFYTFSGDDFLIVLLTGLMLLSCICVIVLLLRNEKNEKLMQTNLHHR
jgi:hypothetical protein